MRMESRESLLGGKKGKGVDEEQICQTEGRQETVSKGALPEFLNDS